MEALDPISVEFKRLQVEEDKVRVEREKLQLERDKLKQQDDLERVKLKWSALGTTAPILVALFTIGWGVYSLSKTAQNEFAAKAAEIVFATKDPDEAIGRAKYLDDLFPDYLPSRFSARFQTAERRVSGKGPGSSASTEAGEYLIRLLAEHPDERSRILKDWQQVFPGDNWSSRIQ